ncbi:arginase family protein [Paenibacillus sp. FSL R7-0026]|uniref:arginase family protein n=1 Tax=Paenibacillus sp. FSL R7-0026 TaxID=2921668 RepID=UPI0030F72436
MKAPEPAYLVRRIGDTLIAADETFSQFYQIEPAEELETRPIPQLEGIDPPDEPYFSLNPLVGQDSPHLYMLGIPYSGGSGMEGSKVAGFEQSLRAESWKKVMYPALTQSRISGLYDIGSGQRLLESVMMQDLGTCQTDDTDSSYSKGLNSALVYTEREEALLCCIGGDHSITYSILKSILSRSNARIILVQFDAHHDCGVDAIHQNEMHHANFVRHLLTEDGIVAVVQIGLRGLRSVDQMYKHPKLVQIPAEQMTPERVRTTLLDIQHKFQAEAAYLSFDLDCLDPGSFPYVDFPISGGPSWFNTRNCVVAALESSLPYVGFDMVEGQEAESDERIPGQYEMALRMLTYMMDGMHRNYLRHGKDALRVSQALEGTRR